MNMTIMDRARSMRLHVGLSLIVLGRCCRYICLLNKHRTFKIFGWYNSRGGMDSKKVNYYFLKTFGCEAFFHIDKENRTKIEEKSKKCTFIGYGVNDFGYRLWDYENQKIIRSRDVILMRRSCTKISCRGRNRKKKTEYKVQRVLSDPSHRFYVFRRFGPN
jgi:hypothetical protein